MGGGREGRRGSYYYAFNSNQRKTTEINKETQWQLQPKQRLQYYQSWMWASAALFALLANVLGRRRFRQHHLSPMLRSLTHSPGFQFKHTHQPPPLKTYCEAA